MSDTRPNRLRRVSVVSVVALLFTTVLATAVIAFDDVPDDNQFHGSIEWLADNEITLGCNPPENTEFCPGDNVSRQQMAAFMRRLAQTFGTAGDVVTEIGDTVAIDSTSGIEVASVEVTPKAEANVSLDANVTLVIADETSGSLYVAPGSCTADPISSGLWYMPNPTAALQGSTFSITGVAVTDVATTYVLCVDKESGALPDALATQRALTATWSPTS